MRKFLKSISLISKGLRYKLIIAFSLMSIIPLLVCLALVNRYVYKREIIIGNVSLLVLIAALIAILGFLVVKDMIDSIIQLARNTKLLADGQQFERVEIKGEDEISDLNASINKVAINLDENVDTVKGYEERIRSVNMEINKKVTTLSALFQVSNVLSTAKDLNVILQSIIEKFPEAIDCEKGFLLLVDEPDQKMRIKASYNLKPEEIEDIENSILRGVLSKLTKQKEGSMCDSVRRPNNITNSLKNKLGLKNIIVFPIIMHRDVKSVIVIGNDRENFKFKGDNLELIRIVSKQISIAIENDWLIRKTEELAVKDELTGLFNVKYLKERLNEEIQRAITYQRPCSYALFEIDNFDVYQDKYGDVASDEVLKRVASIFKASVEQVDKVARYDNCKFAIILPEKNKREAHMVADKIRKKIEKFNFAHQKSLPGKNLTVCAGVTANPLDGMYTKELISKAQKLLEEAKSHGKNLVYT